MLWILGYIKLVFVFFFWKIVCKDVWVKEIFVRVGRYGDSL